MAAVFIFGETLRRSLNYLSINTTTMFEDYFCGLLLIIAALLWTKGSQHAHKFMIGAWAYTTGGMFVPFFAHLEAYLRGATFRADHPHEDVNSIILNGALH